MEPGCGDWGGAEDFVEVFALMGGWVCEAAEGGDAVEGRWGVGVGFGGGGEDCGWDAAVEVEGLRVEFAGGGEERDVQVHVGDFWRRMYGSRGEVEFCELEWSCQDDRVVNSEVDTGRIGRGERVDDVAAVRLAVDV